MTPTEDSWRHLAYSENERMKTLELITLLGNNSYTL